MFSIFKKTNPQELCSAVLIDIQAVLNKVGTDRLSGDLQRKLDGIAATLRPDYDSMCREEICRLMKRPEAGRQTAQVAALFRSWHLESGGPSLPAMILAAADAFEIDGETPSLKAALVAGLLGEWANALPYHGNVHYKKVLFHAIRLAAAHNEIHEGTDRVLKPGQIALLMAAAAVHDLGHDGKGNGFGETYVRSRLEQYACDLARPYLYAAGFGPMQYDDLETMILCTEVTPIDSPKNPMRQMKTMWRHCFEGAERPVLEGKLRRLYDRPDLVLMAMILHEADLATSAGMTYDATKFETVLFRAEMGFPDARPWHVMSFIENVCDGRFMTEAGRALMDKNLQAIMEAARQDYNAGNSPYASAANAAFLHPKIAGAITPKQS